MGIFEQERLRKHFKGLINSQINSSDSAKLWLSLHNCHNVDGVGSDLHHEGSFCLISVDIAVNLIEIREK